APRGAKRKEEEEERREGGGGGVVMVVVLVVAVCGEVSEGQNATGFSPKTNSKQKRSIICKLDDNNNNNNNLQSVLLPLKSTKLDSTRERERGRELEVRLQGHPALLTPVTPPLRKYGCCCDLWQPHTTAPKHQRALTLHRPHKREGVMEGSKGKKERMRERNRGSLLFSSGALAKQIHPYRPALAACLQTLPPVSLVPSHLGHSSSFISPLFLSL
ncbi:hypothetical protein INR49_032656, partial [Caranx melampygus]